MKNKHILGIDTSNYKTSVAVIDQDSSIICDLRRFLVVKQGERGLRQSDALFQHIKNLPELFEELSGYDDLHFEAVSYSSRPRPADDSYMPVFLAGESSAKTAAAVLDIPVFSFSHQEGHIEAIKAFSAHRDKDVVLACHFSGGTSEVILAEINGSGGYRAETAGGSMDIAFGQLIDRAGVMLGMNFPAGGFMDRQALSADHASSLITPVKVRDGWLNLSGTDTQVKRIIEASDPEESAPLARELFDVTAAAMSLMIRQCVKKTGVRDVIMAGGVSSSVYIRRILSEDLRRHGIRAEFGMNSLAQDNAVGTALLGGRNIWG